MMKTIFI